MNLEILDSNFQNLVVQTTLRPVRVYRSKNTKTRLLLLLLPSLLLRLLLFLPILLLPLLLPSPLLLLFLLGNVLSPGFRVYGKFK